MVRKTFINYIQHKICIFYEDISCPVQKHQHSLAQAVMNGYGLFFVFVFVFLQ